MQYLKQGRFRMEDVYKSTPFVFYPTEDFGQLLGQTNKNSFS